MTDFDARRHVRSGTQSKKSVVQQDKPVQKLNFFYCEMCNRDCAAYEEMHKCKVCGEYMRRM